MHHRLGLDKLSERLARASGLIKLLCHIKQGKLNDICSNLENCIWAQKELPLFGIFLWSVSVAFVVAGKTKKIIENLLSRQ